MMNEFKKMWYVHTMKYHLIIKRNEMLKDVTAWMNLEHIMLSEGSQSNKPTYCMMPYI